MWWIASAQAWDQVGATWAPEDRPVEVWLGDVGDLPDSEVEAAAQAAMATWSDVDCADIDLVYAGRAPDAIHGSADGKNVLSVLSAAWAGEAALLSEPVIVRDGARMVEVDIALNDHDHAFVTSGADGLTTFDVQGGFTHELGHLLGLWHSTVADASLNPLLDGRPQATSLAEDDITGLCEIYAVGTGGLGEVCGEGPDCASGTCLADGADRYCTVTCPDDSCPDGYDCLDASGDQVCVKASDGGCGCRSASAPGSGALAAGFAVCWMRIRRRRVAAEVA